MQITAGMAYSGWFDTWAELDAMRRQQKITLAEIRHP
jgi:hypothetical protein